MISSKFALRRLSLAAATLAMLLSGCAAIAPASPEVAVQQRATARAQAQMKGENETAYALMAPSYRAKVDLKRFASDYAGARNWVAFEVVNVTCEEQEKCVAKLRIDFKPLLGARFGDTITTYVDETWLREGGQWWLFPKL